MPISSLVLSATSYSTSQHSRTQQPNKRHATDKQRLAGVDEEVWVAADSDHYYVRLKGQSKC